MDVFTCEQHARLDELACDHGSLVIDACSTDDADSRFLLVRPQVLVHPLHVHPMRAGWIVAPDGRCTVLTRRYLPVDARERPHGPGDCHGAMAATDVLQLAAAGVLPADLCPCGTYRVGDCAPIGHAAPEPVPAPRTRILLALYAADGALPASQLRRRSDRAVGGRDALTSLMLDGLVRSRAARHAVDVAAVYELTAAGRTHAAIVARART